MMNRAAALSKGKRWNESSNFFFNEKLAPFSNDLLEFKLYLVENTHKLLENGALPINYFYDRSR